MTKNDGKNKFLKVLPFLIVTIVFLVLLWVATNHDYQISEAIARLNGGKYYSQSVLGRAFEIFGEFPLFFILAVSFAFVFKGLPQFFERKLPKFNKKAILLTFKIVCAVLMIISYAYYLKTVFKHIGELSGNEFYQEKKLLLYAVSACIGMIFSAITLLLVNKIKDEKVNGLFIWGIIAIVAAVLSQGLVLVIIKPLFGRMRFRAIYVLKENGLENLANYTKWYVFSGKGVLTEEMLNLGLNEDIFKSFPSGHIAAAAMVFALAFLPEFLSLDEKKTKRIKLIIWCGGIVFTVVSAIFRMVMGAHYLSDVLFGGYITYLMVIISAKVLKTLVKKLNLL